MATALIALGSNLGNRQRNLDDAVAQLDNTPNVVVLATSRWRETKPVGGPADQGEFLNGAALLGTSLTPQQLHAILQQIETAAGRTREGRWAPRTLDLDLLLYDDLVLDTPELKLPHPRMPFRRFVLEPAAEIAPDMRHPQIGWTIAELALHLQDTWTGYMAAIGGLPAAGKTKLSASVPREIRGRLLLDPVRVERPASWQTRRIESNLEEHLDGLSRRVARVPRRFEWAHEAYLSDFWLDQSNCLAELTLPDEQLAVFREQFRAATGRIAKPKLLVFLDVPPDVSWQRIAERGDPNPPRIDWLAKYRELLLKRVAEPGRGPVLRLDGTKSEEAKDELIAAIQSMQ
jgi:2-amino-4-hydroxy-6-hydroxymethyldihydropteridine diphosphokinase